jgi:hypothetical protein
MGRLLIDEYLRLLDAAFRQPPSLDGDTPSLIGNLQSVPVEAWDWQPPRGVRRVRDIVLHLGECKYGYDDSVFRAEPDRHGPPHGWRKDDSPPPAEVVAWLDAAHARFTESVAALPDDSELDRERPTRWGPLALTRDVITGMIHRDNCHAGEINHIRALFMENDAWAWE